MGIGGIVGWESGAEPQGILSKRRGQICSSRVRDSAGERRITDPPWAAPDYWEDTFGQASLRGTATDPPVYLAANARWLGIIKRKRRPDLLPALLDL